MRRDYSFDFIRALCAIEIVMFHFFVYLEETFVPVLAIANVDWGAIIVTTFFTLSGLLLYRNNSSVNSIKLFYYKRWKTIFPSFYLVFIYCFVLKALENGKIFYAGNGKMLILSILGIDGYFIYLRPNYYIMGEWFLGAIIIIYFLYPCLLKLFNKYAIMTTVLGVLGLFFANCSMFKIDPFRNLLSCLCSFVFGMFIEKYQLLQKKTLLLGFTLLFLYLIAIPLNYNWNILAHIEGISMMFFLYPIGTRIMKLKVTKLLFLEISKVSYGIFLIHHMIVYRVVSELKPIEFGEILNALIICVVLSICMAKILLVVTNSIFCNKIYVFFENKFIYCKKPSDRI